MSVLKRLGTIGVIGCTAAILAACGNSDAPTADNNANTVAAATDASNTDLALDASTSDAMSVDVAAGGVTPMADPMAEPALTDPMANATTEEPPEKAPPGN